MTERMGEGHTVSDLEAEGHTGRQDRSQVVNALDVLRFVIAGTGSRLTASETALADLDALVQAAQNAIDKASIAQGLSALVPYDAMTGLADALARVKGEA
jgi:hypothetical protein